MHRHFVDRVPWVQVLEHVADDVLEKNAASFNAHIRTDGIAPAEEPSDCVPFAKHKKDLINKTYSLANRIEHVPVDCDEWEGAKNPLLSAHEIVRRRKQFQATPLLDGIYVYIECWLSIIEYVTRPVKIHEHTM